MNIEQVYEAAGADYAEAIARLGKPERVQKFALKLPKDDSMANLRAAVESGDVATSFRMAHTLKGVAGNLSFTALYQAASDLTEQLRPQEAPADPALMEAVERAYARTISALEALD